MCALDKRPGPHGGAPDLYNSFMLRLLTSFLLLAFSAFAADVTGTWNFEVNTDAGNGSPKFVLKQDGDKITGTYSGALGEAKVTGTVKGNEVTLEFNAGAAVVYIGTLDETGKKMSGSVDLGGQATGTFKGEKTSVK
jgi:hypothetical protein